MSYKKSTTGGGLAAAPSHSAGGASGQHVPQSELRPQSNVVLRVGPGVAARRHFGQVFLFGREIGPLLYLRANHVSREQRGQALLGLGQRQRCGPGNCGSGPTAKGWVRRASWSGSGGIIRRSGDCADWTISPQGLFGFLGHPTRQRRRCPFGCGWSATACAVSADQGGPWRERPVLLPRPSSRSVWLRL